MKRSNFILPLAVLFTLFYSAMAQEMKPLENSTEFVNKLKETSKLTQTIRTDFVEEKYGSYLKEPQKASGVFYYKKSNKIRWEKTQPFKYVFLANGDKIKVQDNGKEVNLSSANKIVSKINELMLTLVNGEFNSGRIFNPSYFENNDTYAVKLIPKIKKLGNLYSYIMLSFSKETLLLKELAFYEKSGDKSIMTFSNSKINQAIDDTLFTNF